MDENGKTDTGVAVIDESLKDEVIPYQYSITSYGADYPIDGLVKRLEAESLFIPSFQRSYVWTLNQASRFIESLLLGLPVPGIFLSKEPETGKLLVIDGQQRLRTLLLFYSGVFQDGRAFTLRNVQPTFEGKTYRKLEERDRLRLDDSIIHATIVKQDEPSEDQSSIYHIFERLNTGGTLLQPQEIRACIFHGPFNELLSELNKTPEWRDIYGPLNKRLKDQELILRFLALYFDGSSYERPMKEFLNRFMGRNRRLQAHDESTVRKAFINNVTYLAAALGKNAFRPERALNAAVYDAVMVGLADRLSRGMIKDRLAFKAKYEELLKNKEFSKSCRTATSDEANVRKRIELAREFFLHLH